MHNSIDNPNLLFLDFNPPNSRSYTTADWSRTLFMPVTEEKAYSSIGSVRTNWTITNLSYLNNTGDSSLLMVTNWDYLNQQPTWHADGQSIHEFYRGGTGSTAAYLVVNKTGICGQDLPRPDADFSTNKSYGILSLAVQFYDTSYGNPTAWNWSFGDGAYSNSQNPVHNYTALGDYSANLTVTNAAGNDSIVKSMTVQEYPEIPLIPVVDFTCAPVVGTGPLPVTCQDHSTNNPIARYWAFGNPGDPDYAETSEQTPTVDLYTAGLRNVTLTVSNNVGYVSLTKAGYIEVINDQPVTADFDVSPDSGTPPLWVQFYDRSTNANNWSWDFGDGTNSTVREPVHLFTSQGTFTVQLNVSNNMSTDSASKNIEVSISLPVADFSVSKTYINIPQNVTATDYSRGEPDSWYYLWGDGTNTTGIANPSHQYLHRGPFTINLTVGNAIGNSSKLLDVRVVGAAGG
jgi:PKD repeat protein